MTPRQVLVEDNDSAILANRESDQLELEYVEKSHSGRAVASVYLDDENGSSVSVYSEQESGEQSFQIQGFTAASFEPVGEDFVLNIESPNTSGALVKPVSMKAEMYSIISARAASISVSDETFSTSIDSVYLIQNGENSDGQRQVQAIAGLQGCEVVDVYEKEIEGWVYLQIEVPGQLDGGTGFASVNGYPIFNEGLYSQVVIVPIQLPTVNNDLDSRTTQSKEDGSQRLILSSFSVYPNPSSGNLFANIPSFDGCAGEVVILSSRGDEVVRQSVGVEDASRIEFKLDRFPTGLYFAHYINDCGESQAVRFVLR